MDDSIYRKRSQCLWLTCLSLFFTQKELYWLCPSCSSFYCLFRVCVLSVYLSVSLILESSCYLCPNRNKSIHCHSLLSTGNIPLPSSSLSSSCFSDSLLLHLFVWEPLSSSSRTKRLSSTRNKKDRGDFFFPLLLLHHYFLRSFSPFISFAFLGLRLFFFMSIHAIQEVIYKDSIRKNKKVKKKQKYTSVDGEEGRRKKDWGKECRGCHTETKEQSIIHSSSQHKPFFFLPFCFSILLVLSSMYFPFFYSWGKLLITKYVSLSHPRRFRFLILFITQLSHGMSLLGEVH